MFVSCMSQNRGYKSAACLNVFVKIPAGQFAIFPVTTPALCAPSSARSGLRAHRSSKRALRMQLCTAVFDAGKYMRPHCKERLSQGSRRKQPDKPGNQHEYTLSLPLFTFLIFFEIELHCCRSPGCDKDASVVIRLDATKYKETTQKRLMTLDDFSIPFLYLRLKSTASAQQAYDSRLKNLCLKNCPKCSQPWLRPQVERATYVPHSGVRTDASVVRSCLERLIGRIQE